MSQIPASLPTWKSDTHARISPRGFPLLPGGVGRNTYYAGRTPTYAIRGEGCFMWDDQGQKLIDLNNNFTSLIHGVAHPEVVEAATKAMEAGSCWGIPNLHEWDHAELLLARFPELDQVRYCNSGTEAVMTAVRVARACTGRDGVVMTRNGYHGSSDIAFATGDANARRGIPKGVSDDATLIDINDTAALREAVEANPQKFAAIIIDLIPNRAGLIRVTEDYARTARELATRYGIVLIIDEVISLRLGHGGYAQSYGITPDLLTMGKLIGGGFPVGAVVGIEALMRVFDPTSSEAIPQAGTFSGNPVSMAAGAATLRLFGQDVVDRMNAQGARMRAAVSEGISAHGWHVRGDGSLFRAYPNDPVNSAARQNQLWWEAYARGLLFSQTNLGSLSSPMTDEIADQISERTIEAVLAVDKA